MSSTIRLRASCERCRGQKLRCLPSHDLEPSAPYKRCVKAKIAESCVFGPRSRTQRPALAKTSPGKVLQGKDSDMEAAFPGTSLFSLYSHSPSGSDAEISLSSVSIQDASLGFRLDECRPQSNQLVSTEVMPETWEDGSQEAVFQQYSWNDSAFMEGIDHPLSGHTLTFNPNSTHVISSDPLVDLTNLLADMYPYKQQLSRLPNGGISNYPIGDALYFSHLFHTILSPNGTLRQGSTISALGTPTVLLVLSCFMTLNRIYSVIFRNLTETLSRGLATHRSSNGFADFRSYRGLRLNQLHQICLCSEEELIKNAISMLLESLGSAEDLLDLAQDVRVTTSPEANLQKHQSSSLGRPGREEGSPFVQDSPPMMESVVFDATVGLQAKELRKEVKQVMELLEKKFYRGRDEAM